MNFLVTEVHSVIHSLLYIIVRHTRKKFFVDSVFLVAHLQGYVDAAMAFHKETGTDPGVDLSSIRGRMEIRKSVQSGNIESAIEHVNDLDPEILEQHHKLMFHLQQQWLIELIRAGSIEEALGFAQEQLAPRGEDSPAFLEELERTLALLVFENPAESPLGDLLEMTQRQKTASELNEAILESQSLAGKPKLPNLLKVLVWAQQLLEEKAQFPKIDDVLIAVPQLPSRDEKDDGKKEESMEGEGRRAAPGAAL